MARFEKLDVNELNVKKIVLDNDFDGTGGTEMTATATELNNLAAGSDTISGNVGTAATGVTAAEYGNAYMHHTILTLAMTDAFTLGDNAALADGALIYTFPAGEIIVHGSYMSTKVTAAEDTTSTAEVGLGTTAGSAAAATLGADDAACENISEGLAQTALDGAQFDTQTKGTQLVIADAGDHTVYLNIADTWADTAGSDLTADVAGEVHLIWSFMGNPA